MFLLGKQANIFQTGLPSGVWLVPSSFYGHKHLICIGLGSYSLSFYDWTHRGQIRLDLDSKCFYLETSRYLQNWTAFLGMACSNQFIWSQASYLYRFGLYRLKFLSLDPSRPKHGSIQDLSVFTWEISRYLPNWTSF